MVTIDLGGYEGKGCHAVEDAFRSGLVDCLRDSKTLPANPESVAKSGLLGRQHNLVAVP